MNDVARTQLTFEMLTLLKKITSKKLQMPFLEWNVYLIKYMIEMWSHGSIWQYISTGLDYGLLPFRRQANVDIVHRRIYASSDLSESCHVVSFPQICDVLMNAIKISTHQRPLPYTWKLSFWNEIKLGYREYHGDNTKIGLRDTNTHAPNLPDSPDWTLKCIAVPKDVMMMGNMVALILLTFFIQ